MRRSVARSGAVVGLLAVVVVGAPPSGAVDKGATTVSPSAPTATWTGDFALPFVVGLTDCDPTSCDTLALTVDVGSGRADLAVTVDQPGDLSAPGVEILDAAGTSIEESSGLASATVEVDDIAPGTYTVRVFNGSLTPASAYTATATLTPGPAPVDPGSLPTDTVLRDVDEDAAVASAEVPLRVVMVGFEPGSVDEEAVFAEIPDHQRVGVLQAYGGEGRSGDDGLPGGVTTLLNHGRAYYDENEPNTLPIEFEWAPELHYAPPAFAQGLFDAMVASSETGDYADPLRRAYLEAYNLRGSLYRVLASGDPAQAVAPLSPVRFVDGEDTEDWIAANAEAALGFPVGRDPGQPGYTVFVLNTWDAPEAAAFPAGEYHAFRIDRTDPDRGDFDGIDWARVWGGRYRFMMIDAGAAPNPYEAESWGNRGRTLTGSALHDPPLWEHRAGAPRPVTAIDLYDGLGGLERAITPLETWDEESFQYVLSRTVNEAVNFRFFHSYLYEPRPGTGRFYLSDNVWHDSTTLYGSDLELLYHQQAALEGLRSLTPYFEFDGDVQYQYLADQAAHPEYAADQAALDQAKADGDDVAGVPHLSMRTSTMMDYIDGDPTRFLRGGPCATTVPTIQVVVPGAYAWALPIAAGIATNRAGVPWGFLNSVNDVTKWNGADKDQTLVLAHPNVYNGTFTYTTIHEASHYLGLAHPHDTVGAVRGENGEPVYYDGFTWTFNTTASPTTYSHVETTYSVLDQESIARGHLSYYLQWTNEALEEAGEEWAAAGQDTIGELPPAAAAARAAALAEIDEARALFAGFDFVRATFSAQAAWQAAADYRDLALGL
ncbi:MAG: hypothetical protein H0W25_11060, partial [Acidimicrobiia bacterium]|nr:hypothetical protein [Acidimicrobiia bacterium]